MADDDMDKVGQDPLPEDNDTPFSEPDEASDDKRVDTHPSTDTDMDEHEKYDAGTETASYQRHVEGVEEGEDTRLENSDVEETY